MVPNGWKTYIVEEIAASRKSAMSTGPFGSAISSKYFVEEGVPVIRGGNLSNKPGVKFNEEGLVFVTEEKAKEFKRSLVSTNDLIFTCWGTINQVGIIPENSNYPKYVISNKQMKLSLNLSLAAPEYIYTLFSSHKLQHKISSEAIGSSVPGFNLGQLKSIKLTIPPLHEQQKITKILSTWDRAISITERLIDNSTQQKKALMQQLLTGKKRLLDESGKQFEIEWNKNTLSNLCQISTGKKDVNEGSPNGKYPFYTCAKEHTFSDAYSFDCEALLIAGNGNIGTTHYYNGKFEAYQRTYVLKEFKDINIKYLFQFLLYALNREVERNKQHGAMPYIKVGFLNNFIVLTPSLEEQQKIATVLTNADEEIDLFEQQLADLQQEKKALMQVLLTGKKRVKLND